MRFSLRMLQPRDFDRLIKSKPQQIKALIEPNHGYFGRDELWSLDPSWNGARVHAQLGDVFCGVAGNANSLIVPIGSSSHRAAIVGESACDLKGGGRVTLSISRNPYIGLYRYRYLPEVEDA
jgi:hypothetical protein